MNPNIEVEHIRARGLGWHKILVPISADWFVLRAWCLSHLGKEEGYLADCPDYDPSGNWFADISPDRWLGNTEPHVFYFNNESDAERFLMEFL